MRSVPVKMFFVCCVLFFVSCKKEAGVGGTGSIRGKVWGRYYDKTFFVKTDSGYVPNVDVYIIYGGQSAVGNHIKTAYDGTYEFKYLRTGSYKVFTYSRDSSGFYLHQVNIYAPPVAIIKSVDISDGDLHPVVSDMITAQK